MVELTVNDGPKAGAEVLRSLDAAEITIAGLALREPSLDDVFLSLTGHKTDHRRGRRTGCGEAEEGLRPGPQSRRDRRKGCRMTTITVPPVQLLKPDQGHRLSWALADIVTMAKRNILAVLRTPEALFFTTLQPIMFVLLFTYVFGGAIHVPGGALHRLPDAGRLRADRDLRRHGLVGRPRRRPAQGDHRALPRPAR